MPTILSFLSGRQITNDSGVPQSGAKLLHYREGTTTALTVWQNDAASVAHPQPVVCDAGGFVPLIYVDDTFDWKVEIKTSADVTLKTYDNLPKAETDETAAGFAPPLLEWTQVTSAASPVALTVNDVGKAYEADTTGGSIEFDLPDAASVGNGKGFVFKKTAAANTMTIDPNGTQTIDDVSTSLAITAKDTVLGIFSNGAEWYTVDGVVTADMLRSTFINGLTAATALAEGDEILVQLSGGGAFRKIARPNFAGERFIESGTVTNAATKDFTIPTNCDVLEIELINWLPATDNVNLLMRFSQASSFLAGAADYTWGYFRNAATTDSSDAEIRIIDTWGNAAGENGNLFMRIYRPSASAFAKSATWLAWAPNTTSLIAPSMGGGRLIANTNAIDGVRFLFSSGNIAEGFYIVRAYKFA